MFATTELLENILLHIDTKTLLLAQRVNHKFNSVIRSSGQLQKLLFFSHATIEEAIKLFVSGGETECADRPSMCLSTDERIVSGNLIPLLPSDPRILNPLLFMRPLPRRTVGEDSVWGLGPVMDQSDQLVEGSWKRMYIPHGHPLVVEVKAEPQALTDVEKQNRLDAKSYRYTWVKASSLVEAQEAARLQLEEVYPSYTMDRKELSFTVIGYLTLRGLDLQDQEVEE